VQNRKIHMNLMQFADVIDMFPSFNVLVIGDIMLDTYEYCLTSESRFLHSEKPGKRAYKSQKAVKVLGGAGNVAVTLSSLGAKTYLIGITGNDENYFKIRELSDASNISHFIVRDPSRPTTTKRRLYIDDEYILRQDNECADKIDKETSATLMREILYRIPMVDVVILSDYNKGLFTELNSPEIIRECRMHNIPLVVDFKPANKSLFAGADVISPNENEAKELLPSFSFQDLENSVRKLYDLLYCNALVVTLGDKGLCGFDGSDFFCVPGIKVNAHDAVGCGDTVRAVIALGISSKLSLNDAAGLANYAAAVIVQKPLTSTLTRLELLTFIKGKIQ
jgi:D-glycero-beta-D-manno-heptose-7-phosphate kinase